VLPLLSIGKDESVSAARRNRVPQGGITLNRPPDASSSSRQTDPCRSCATSIDSSSSSLSNFHAWFLRSARRLADRYMQIESSFQARVAISGLRFQVKILIAESRRFPTTPDPLVSATRGARRGGSWGRANPPEYARIPPPGRV